MMIILIFQIYLFFQAEVPQKIHDKQRPPLWQSKYFEL